jgi:Flp pilus assembly pilin Flp
VLVSILAKRISSQSGQTIVEYGLILALISIAGLIGLGLFSGGLLDLYDLLQSAADCMSNMVSGGSCT